MAPLTFQTFEPTDEAYDELATLWTALNPEWPRVGRIWRSIDAADHGDGPIPRIVAHRDGRLVASGEFSDPPYGGEGTYEVSFFARPEAGGPEALGQVYDGVMKQLEPHEPKTLIGYARDTRPWMVAFYEARGFSADQHTAYTRLDVAGFDARPYAERVLDVARAGYEVISATELAKEGDAWRRGYWELDGEVLRDVPILGGFRPMAFEAFARDLDNPDRFQLDAVFIARDMAGRFVGTARLCVPKEITESAFGGLTGVVRDQRRRGLATALKLATIGYAREHGFRWISTLNEANNPMLGLNHALGFETRYTQLTMQRLLGS